MATKESQESKSDVESHARPVKDRTTFPPILPADFAYWKLTPPAVGLVGLEVYLGFRKQVWIGQCCSRIHSWSVLVL